MDATKDLKWFIFIIVILWLVWYFTGGPTNSRVIDGGAFLKPPAPLNTGKTYGELPVGSFKKDSQTNKTFRRAVTLTDVSGAKKSLGSGEYIEITSSLKNDKFINISNWKVKNSQRKNIQIGIASKLPFLNKINKEGPLYLGPGEKAFISTGRSPIGVSFKVNKCSGYLEQFQNFTPPLKEECPTAISNPNIFSYNLEPACLNYLSSLNTCKIPLKNPPSLSVSCLYFLEQELNYNSCVNTHRYDSNFYKPEWRIYLKQTKGLWNNFKEKIDLLDSDGKMVDTIWY